MEVNFIIYLERIALRDTIFSSSTSQDSSLVTLSRLGLKYENDDNLACYSI